MSRYTLDMATAAAVRAAVKESCPNFYNGLCVASDKPCYVLAHQNGISCHFAWHEVIPNYPELFAKIRTQYNTRGER